MMEVKYRMNIHKLLKPRKIAIIGASEKEGFGGDTCRNAIAYMDEEKYFFVNPRRDEVLGKKCRKSIADLPDDVDLAVICTPAATVEDMLRDCAAKGVKGAVVYASGYGEVGTAEGKEAERRLQDLCEQLDIALMGPNCAGYANMIDKVYPFAFISEERDRSGNIGIISQSGQLILSIMDSPKVKFSYAISAGNSKIVTMEDYLEFLIDDADTKVVAMYLEGVRNPERFMKALKKAAEIRKPVVVLKSGRSEKAQAIAASHTGSLSGADKVFDALFEKFGVIRVDDLEELIATSQALATLKRIPRGKGLAAISLSGGETGICADVAHLTGLEYFDFSDSTLKSLNDILPSYATPNNPLDSTATLSYDAEAFAKVLEIIMKDEKTDLVAVGYTLLQEIADNAIYYMSEAMDIVSGQPWCKPMMMVPFAEMSRNKEYCDKLEKIGVPVLPTALYAFKVIKNVLNFAAYDIKEHDLDVSFKNGVESGTGERVALTEAESKSIVAEYGVPTGRFEVAKTQNEAVAVFNKLKAASDAEDFAVVAKIDSRDVLHKSDVGGVILNLKNENDVAATYAKILDNVKANCPDARISGVQICEMAKTGVEMIIGVNNDPQFGPCVLCGLGGIFVEIFKDTSLALAPISLKEAQKMVRSLKGYKMLTGYRGNPNCDVDAFAELIRNISLMAVDKRDELLELDLNPVFLYEEGLCAADALYVKRS